MGSIGAIDSRISCLDFQRSSCALAHSLVSKNEYNFPPGLKKGIRRPGEEGQLFRRLPLLRYYVIEQEQFDERCGSRSSLPLLLARGNERIPSERGPGSTATPTCAIRDQALFCFECLSMPSRAHHRGKFSEKQKKSDASGQKNHQPGGEKMAAR